MLRRFFQAVGALCWVSSAGLEVVLPAIVPLDEELEGCLDSADLRADNCSSDFAVLEAHRLYLVEDVLELVRLFFRVFFLFLERTHSKALSLFLRRI